MLKLSWNTVSVPSALTLITAGLGPVLQRLVPRRYRGIKQLTPEEMEHLEEIEARRRDLRERVNNILAGRLIKPLILLALGIRYISGKKIPPQSPRNDR